MQRHNTPPTKTRVLSKPEHGVTEGFAGTQDEFLEGTLR
jgi:hypothetical protein